MTSGGNSTAAIKASFNKMDKEGRWSYLCKCYSIVKTGSQPGKNPVDLYQLTIELPWISSLPPLPQQPSASRLPSPPRPPSASAVDPMGKGKGVGIPLAAGPAPEASPGRGRAQQRERSCSRTPSRGAQASPGAQPAAGPGTSTPPRAPSNHSRRSSSSSSAASMTSNPVENAASANTAWLQQQLGKRQRAPSSSGSSVAF